MPQLLRRTDASIDWSVQAVANHPVLTSGVGACITAFASTEALMGVFLATIRWEHAPQAIEAWARLRTVREKLRLIEAEADLTGVYYRKMAVQTLDAFTRLSKKRNKLAQGFFGIVTDRENQLLGGKRVRLHSGWRRVSPPLTCGPPQSHRRGSTLRRILPTWRKGVLIPSRRSSSP